MPKAKLNKKLRSLNAELSDLHQKIGYLNSVIRKSNDIKHSHEIQISGINFKIKKLAELAILENALDNPAIGLHRKVLDLMNRAKREDITILKKKQLDAETRSAVKDLKKACPHSFILNYDGYEGSYTNDYSDARHGFRLCVVCGHTEFSEATEKEVYKSLSENENRLIKRDIRRLEREDCLAWGSLDYYIEAFRRSVGITNIHWPIIKEGKITEGSDAFYNFQTP